MRKYDWDKMGVSQKDGESGMTASICFVLVIVLLVLSMFSGHC